MRVHAFSLVYLSISTRATLPCLSPFAFTTSSNETPLISPIPEFGGLTAVLPHLDLVTFLAIAQEVDFLPMICQLLVAVQARSISLS